MLKIRYLIFFNLFFALCSLADSQKSSHPLEKTYDFPLETKYSYRPSNISPSYSVEKLQRELPHILLKPGTYTHSLTKENGKPIFSVDYTLLDHLQRKIPSTPSTVASFDKFLLLIGGSNTVGHWVSDKHTLGNQLQKIFNSKGMKINVNQIGNLGGSLASIYKSLQTINIQKAFPENRGTIIYNFFYYHVSRDNCLPPAIMWTRGKAPRYILENNKLRYVGKCHKKISVKWHLWLNKIISPFSFILKSLPFEQPNYEDFIDKEHVKLSLHLLKSIEELFLENGKKVDILVLNNNIYSPQKNAAFKYFKKQIKRSSFKFVPMEKDILKKKYSELTFKYDSHYNEKGYKFLADLIFQGLRELEETRSGLLIQ